MSTTIDSLDIQIRSSAGSAANNIEALARSLGQLKSAANLTKITNQLGKLKTSLDGLRSVNSGLQNLEKFGRTLSKLNSISIDSSGLSKTINTLRKLPALAGELKSLDLNGLPEKMQSLGNALSGLSNIANPKGLTSSLNALKKIPEITNSLDTRTIDTFGDRIERLASRLAPLAAQIEKVGNGFAKLPSQVSKTVTATNRMEAATRKATEANRAHSKSLDTTNINLMATIQNLQEYVQAINFVADGVANVLDDAMQWDGIQFRFGRAFGEDAEEILAYSEKVSEQLGINQQQFMQYSSLYGSLLSGFGMAQKDVTTISVGLTELSYDIWAAYNDRYKTLEDASEAVRSAITGEIEPIRNAGIALTEASMQEYLDSLGMAEIKMANLSEAQKSEVRYATMVNAAMNQGIVGTYAAEMNTAEGVMRNLAQQTKTLAQAFGSLFIPVLMRVIPYVTAFVNVLTDAIRAVASFFGVELQKIDWGNSASGAGGGIKNVADNASDAAGALKDAGKEAKKLKDYTMGFDELNIISPDSDSSGSGGGAGGSGGAGGGIGGGGLGLDLDTLWDESVFAKAGKKVDELKNKMLAFLKEWKTELLIISGALATLGMAKLLGNLSEAIGFGNTFTGILNGIKKAAGTTIVMTLQFMLQKASFDSFIDGEGILKYFEAMLIGGISSFVLWKTWGVGGLAIGLGVTALASFSAVWENGGITNAESATVALTGLVSAFAALGLASKALKGTKFFGELGAFFALLKEGNGLIPTLSAAFPALSNAIAGVLGDFGAFFALLKEGNSLTSVLAATFPKAANALAPIGAGLAAIGGGSLAVGIAVVVAVVAALASVIYFLKQNWEEVKAAAKNFFDINIVPKLEEIKEHWNKIKEALSPLAPIFNKVKEAVEPLIAKVSDFFGKIDLSSVLSGIGKAIEVIGGILFAAFSGTVAGAFSYVVNIIESFIQVISGVIQVVSNVVGFVVNIFKGDWDNAWQSAKDTVKGVIDIWSGLWDMTVGSVVAFVEGVIDWFKSLWDELVGHSIVPDTIDSIVEWFLSLPGKVLAKLKQEFIDPVINKFSDMKKGITEKVDEIKTMFSNKWTEIKNWFTTNVSPKLTKKYWSDKWDDMKQGIASKLDEVKGSIAEKWNAIKEWYNSTVAPKFTKEYWVGKFEGLKEGFTTTIKNMVNTGIEYINKFIGWLNEKMKFSWEAFEIAGKEIVPAGSIQLFTIPKLPMLATGGFVNEGQMFIAREAGPELVGSINGRTSVANNDQIVEAVSQGVYNAVMAAMGNNNNGSGEQNINVYLDGKAIYSSVKKTENERGRTLMGNQLGYGY